MREPLLSARAALVTRSVPFALEEADPQTDRNRDRFDPGSSSAASPPFTTMVMAVGPSGRDLPRKRNLAETARLVIYPSARRGSRSTMLRVLLASAVAAGANDEDFTREHRELSNAYSHRNE